MTTPKSTRVVQAYVFFGGKCEEALEFYRKALGAETLMLMRYKESPEPPAPGMIPPGFEEKVMHASFRIGETTVMGSDGCCAGEQAHNGFCLSLTVGTEAEAKEIFAALSEGGEVGMPLAKTFFSPQFGMVTDRFGINWMVLMPAE